MCTKVGSRPPGDGWLWAGLGVLPRVAACHEATAVSAISDVEENGFVRALDPNVEAVDRAPTPGLFVGNESPTPVSRHQRQDGIAVVGGLVGKIEAGVELAQHSARDDAGHHRWARDT